MPFPGIPSAGGCLESIGQAISGLVKTGSPPAFKIPLRVAGAIGPAFLGSVFFKGLSPVFVAASIAASYVLLNPLQERLFEFSPNERQWLITLPVHALFVGWAGILALVGSPEQIGRSAGAMVLITAVSIWPVYMGQKAYARKKRRPPFKAAFTFTAAIVIVQQALIFGGRF